MRDLHKWFEVPFDDKNISVQELFAFSTDHWQRMTANNPGGQLDARIAATAPAIALVETQFSGDLTKLGLRKASKETKNDFRAKLPAKVTVFADAITGKYGSSSPVHTECFPQGRTVFGRCADDEVTANLKTMIDGLTAHQTDLGAPLIAEATALKAAWLAIYGTSEAATGAKTTTQESKKAARENLQLMLYLNVVKLMEMFPRQPEKLDLYMQLSLLEDHPHQPPPPTP
jgi:hypothetical protein